MTARGIPVPTLPAIQRGARDRGTDAIVRMLRDAISADTAAMAAMVADKPNVIDGHSDGKRVRYARTETRRETLATILAILESAS
jgi:hypothetical protein